MTTHTDKSKDNRPIPQIVYLEWIDSASEQGWRGSDEIEKLGDEYCHCRSIGFLVKETKTTIILALSAGAHEDSAPFADLMHIPKVAITKRVKVPCPIPKIR